jgi:hypothetical protein
MSQPCMSLMSCLSLPLDSPPPLPSGPQTLTRDNTPQHVFLMFLFPQHLCFGCPFLPPLTVSIAIAGTALFRSPRGTRNAVVIVVVVVVFCCFAFTLVLVSFLGGDYHYTTIIFHTTKVNIDIGTKILKAELAGRFRHFFNTLINLNPSLYSIFYSALNATHPSAVGPRF